MPFTTPREAEEMFYAAFQRCNFKAMMNVWADNENIVCIHPGGPRLTGIEQVRSSWQQILGAQSNWTFSISESRYMQDTLRSVHMVKENILINDELQGTVLATNIYQLINDSWRMILHHASPDARIPQERAATATVH